MNNQHQHQHQQSMPTGSGLTRYRSAPSSYFANTPTGDGGFGVDDLEQLFNPRASSPETQRIFSRFMTAEENCCSAVGPVTKIEAEYSSISQSESVMMYENHVNSEAVNVSTSSYNRQLDSFNSNHGVVRAKIERNGGNSSGLIRHSSSPAELFAAINIENEIGTMRAMPMGNFGGGNNANAEASFCSTSCRFKSQMDPISEIGSKGSAEFRDYITASPINSWDDSSLFSHINFLKGVAHNDNTTSSNDQKNEAADRPTMTRLSHHLSLPKSSAELTAMEKLLQDSIPCKIRAKRGCATHPRSIAERVRRTKISERMRKLQELVPNMEKQTNTSDMLDLAVDYIKDLQTQLKTLSDNRAKCSCSVK